MISSAKNVSPMWIPKWVLVYNMMQCSSSISFTRSINLCLLFHSPLIRISVIWLTLKCLNFYPKWNGLLIYIKIRYEKIFVNMWTSKMCFIHHRASYMSQILYIYSNYLYFCLQMQFRRTWYRYNCRPVSQSSDQYSISAKSWRNVV